jgi:hypothetical protein
MHDCLGTQDNLIELLFGELDGATRARLTAEVAACAGCGAHYRSLAETLHAFDAASAAATPRESYWPTYHAALARRLHEAANDARAQSVPFWKRLLTTSIRVPAPLAATALLLLVAVSVLVLSLLTRSAPEPVVVAAPGSTQGAVAPQIKFIEVPVVQEKIITRTIYVPRRDNEDGGGMRQPVAARENLARDVRRNTRAPEAAAAPSRPNLSGFKPAGEVNLRIIKGSDAREQ